MRTAVASHGSSSTNLAVVLGVLGFAGGRVGFDPAPGTEVDDPSVDAASASDAGSEPTGEVAVPDAAQESCPAGESCTSTCSSGCDYVCETGSSCEIDCPTGDCTMTCEPQAQCRLHCGTVPLDGNCAGSGGTNGQSFHCAGGNACSPE